MIQLDEKETKKNVEGTDYIVDIRRPNGSIVTVLIPVEGESYADRFLTKSGLGMCYGLNMVTEGHYS